MSNPNVIEEDASLFGCMLLDAVVGGTSAVGDDDAADADASVALLMVDGETGRKFIVDEACASGGRLTVCDVVVDVLPRTRFRMAIRLALASADIYAFFCIFKFS